MARPCTTWGFLGLRRKFLAVYNFPLVAAAPRAVPDRASRLAIQMLPITYIACIACIPYIAYIA